LFCGSGESFDQSFLQAETVGDDQIRRADRRHLASRGSELVGIHPRSHQYREFGVVAHHSGDDVSENRGGGDHTGAVVGRRAGVACDEHRCQASGRQPPRQRCPPGSENENHYHDRLQYSASALRTESEAVPERRTAELHEAVKRRLEEHNIRYTAGRRSLVTTLVRIEGPESAAELHRRMSDVPLSSLYRSLMVLDEAGVVEKHHDSDGLARYELAEWLMGHHHHVVCVDCGIVEDVSLSDEDEAM